MIWLPLRLGVKSLLLHPLRSLLTVLGIFIGVASVVWLLAISEGISRAAQKQIEDLGVTNIILRSVLPHVVHMAPPVIPCNEYQYPHQCSAPCLSPVGPVYGITWQQSVILINVAASSEFLIRDSCLIYNKPQPCCSATVTMMTGGKPCPAMRCRSSYLP